MQLSRAEISSARTAQVVMEWMDAETGLQREH